MGGKKRRASGHTAACATDTSALAAVRPLAARGVRRNAAGGSAPLRLSGWNLLCRDARQWRAASRRLSAGAKPGGLLFSHFLTLPRSAAKRPGLARSSECICDLLWLLFARSSCTVWTQPGTLAGVARRGGRVRLRDFFDSTEVQQGWSLFFFES